MSRTRLLIVIMLLLSFLSASGCTGTSDTDDAPEQPDSPEPIPEGPEAEEEVEKGTGGNALASEPETVNSETTGQIQTLTVNITAEDQEYPAYISAPAEDGEYPAVVLIHSFNGLEQGYQDMADRLAADGFVVVAPQWQTYSRSPSDSGVEALVRSSINYLKNRDDV
ncbi:MAG: dienelactone hydrolase family protein, partial [Methanosarcina mazei]